MDVTPFKIDILKPPQDDLLSKIKSSSLTLEEGDVVAIASKVISIHQGRTVPREGTDKDALIKAESDLWLPRSDSPGGFVMHTITNHTFIPSAGIDPFGDHYILWPENPKETAEELLKWFKKEYGLTELYLVITDSHSVFLRRGVVGIALAWAGFEPLYEKRVSKDLLGYPSAGAISNLPDAVAAAAVLVMGEQNEQTPLVRLRSVPYIKESKPPETGSKYEVSMEDDIFAPFLKGVRWQRGGDAL